MSLIGCLFFAQLLPPFVDASAPFVCSLRHCHHLFRNVPSCRHKFTHPLRPSYRPPSIPATARLRPERNRFDLEYAVPTEASHFDERAVSDASTLKMRHRVSEVPMKSTHWVGIVKEGTVHLHPLQSLQMVRPDMGHLDGIQGLGLSSSSSAPLGAGGGTMRTSLNSVPFSASSSSSFSPSATSSRTAVAAQFRRTDEKALAARNRSYGFFRTMEETDPWVNLKPVDSKVC